MIYFDKIYVFIYIIFSLLIYIFKGYVLPYPPGSLGPEVTGMIFFVIIQWIRLQICKINLIKLK